MEANRSQAKLNDEERAWREIYGPWLRALNVYLLPKDWSRSVQREVLQAEVSCTFIRLYVPNGARRYLDTYIGAVLGSLFLFWRMPIACVLGLVASAAWSTWSSVSIGSTRMSQLVIPERLVREKND